MERFVSTLSTASWATLPLPFFAAADGNRFGTPWRKEFTDGRRQIVAASDAVIGRLSGEGAAAHYTGAWLMATMNAVTRLRPAWDLAAIDSIAPMIEAMTSLTAHVLTLLANDRPELARAQSVMRQCFRLGDKMGEGKGQGWYHACQLLSRAVDRNGSSAARLAPAVSPDDWRYRNMIHGDRLIAQFALHDAATGGTLFVSELSRGDNDHMAASGLFGKILADTVRAFRVIDAANPDLPEVFATAALALKPALPVIGDRIRAQLLVPRMQDEGVAAMQGIVEAVDQLSEQFRLLAAPTDRLGQILRLGKLEHRRLYSHRNRQQPAWPAERAPLPAVKRPFRRQLAFDLSGLSPDQSPNHFLSKTT